MAPDFTDDQSTLVQVMAWCRQATSHYTWANVDPDLCRHMVSLGHNELNMIYKMVTIFFSASRRFILFMISMIYLLNSLKMS